MKIGSGYIELRGTVKSIEKSLIPGIVLINIEAGEVKIRMDLARKLLVFDEGDKIAITISKVRPKYTEGKDFVAWGYVMSKKKVRKAEGNDIYKLLISLWGYLVILESPNDKILDPFTYMDKVYMKISKV